MAISSWMLRSRTLRSGRFGRSRKENDEDFVKLDLLKDVRISCKEILEGICSTSNISEAKRVNYLNAFVKLILHLNGNILSTGFTREEIFCCLRISLLNESTQVRAGGLRAIRHILNSEDDVLVLNSLQFPYLISRSIDLVLRNESERIQAFKLIRKLLLISSEHFDVTLVRVLISLANSVGEDKDRMLRVCLASLCELGILNSDLFISCGGVAAITRNILECQMPKIVECLCGVLLYLLDKSATRNFAGIDLYCLAAPYCDFHYRHAWMDKNRDERELRFNCSRLALLSVLRSWPGILHFCSPANTSGLQAIVDVLYLNQLEVRKAVLDLLYELLGLPQPEWTDEYSVALNAVDPADPQDSWRLSEGFIAAEGRSVIPHQACTVPNIAEIHLAVLLYVFLELGLLRALVEVIVTSDTFISVRATILLGELLHMIHLLLPPECCNVSPALPNLLAYSTTNRYQALTAVTALHQLHSLLKQRPASSSLYLDHILQSGRFLRSTATTTPTTGERVKRHRTHTTTKLKLYNLVVRSGNDDAIRESGVLQSKEGLSWNWNIIRAILKSDGDYTLRMDDSNHRAFLRRLVHYYRPSSNRYSHLDLTGPNHSHIYTAVGCDLVHCLLAMAEVEGTRLLQEWFTDITSHIDAITTSKSAHDCLFSPLHMSNTLCQTYFLFIGHMCHTQKGIAMLQDLDLFTKLMSLGTTTNHICYVKLIVSSFNYSTDGPPRQILARILCCQHESSRLYATQFLLVLLRAGLSRFEHWGIELLVTQLYDRSKTVQLTALNILHEACEQKPYLEKLVTQKPDLLHLGDKGLLLLIRFLAIKSGFELLNRDQKFVSNEIKRWSTYFNYKYVHLMEAEVLDSLTLHQRSEENGRYDRRHSNVRIGTGILRRDVYMLPHLYGQLVQHEQGRVALLQSGVLDKLFNRVRLAQCRNEKEILELKASLWACGHIATCTAGVELLANNITTETNTNDNTIITSNNIAAAAAAATTSTTTTTTTTTTNTNTATNTVINSDTDIFTAIIRIAEQCPVYSLRGTALYVLGLMGTTFKGANTLFSLGWACVRHNRHDRWPVIEEEDWSRDYFSLASCFDVPSNRSRSESDRTSSDNTCWTDDMLIPHDFPLLPEIDDSLTSTSIIDEESHIITKKSSTLPYSSSNSASMHRRTLSESKTVDAIKKHDQHHLLYNQQQQQQQQQQYHSYHNHPINNNFLVHNVAINELSVPHRFRNNSYTESTTSGVSSCDSALGKFTINDRVQTLSPIPSSSSLSTIKMGLELRRQNSDGLRRVSLSIQSSSASNSLTVSPPELNSGSRLSHHDLVGYNTLRSLRRVRLSSRNSTGGRDDPMLSITGNIRNCGNILLPTTSGDGRRRSHSLSRQFSIGTSGGGGGSSSAGGAGTGGGCCFDDDPFNSTLFGVPETLPLSMGQMNKPQVPDCAREPGRIYMGICLPRYFPKLFPNERAASRRLSFVVSTRDTDDYDDDVERQLNNHDDDPLSEITDCSLTDSPSTSKRKRCYFKHKTRICLICCRAHCQPATTNNTTALGNKSLVTKAKEEQQQQQQQQQQPLDSPNNSIKYKHSISTESNETDAKFKMDILKHAERLSNPIWAKQSKQALLHLKQRHPACFQDICLYSEICNMIGSMTYRVTARRFLQELFLDLNFDDMYTEPTRILNEKIFEELSPEQQQQQQNELLSLSLSSSPTTTTTAIIMNNRKQLMVKSYSRAEDDLAQRSLELSDIVRSHRTPNSIKASDTNRTVTRGFYVDNNGGTTSGNNSNSTGGGGGGGKGGGREEDGGPRHKATTTRQQNDEIRPTSPLTSVVEEDPLTIANQTIDDTVATTTSSSSAAAAAAVAATNEPATAAATASTSLPKITRNTLGSLRLTCSENKFPITNRANTQPITRTWSYGSRSSMRSPVSKQSSVNTTTTPTSNITSPPPSLPNNINTFKLAET